MAAWASGAWASGALASGSWQENAAFSLAADTGTYTYTGTENSLERGLIMAADTAAYTYSGTAVDFLQGFTPHRM